MRDGTSSSHPPGGRVLGVDLGTVRIGLALSNSARSVALPYGVLRRGPNRDADHRAIAAAVADCGATLVVVGLPIALSGGSSATSDGVREEFDDLTVHLDVPVVLVDERLTTVEVLARRKARLGEHDRGRRGGRGGRARPQGVRARRSAPVVDDQAAAVILQSWLDRAPTTEDGTPSDG